MLYTLSILNIYTLSNKLHVIHISEHIQYIKIYYTITVLHYIHIDVYTYKYVYVRVFVYIFVIILDRLTQTSENMLLRKVMNPGEK